MRDPKAAALLKDLRQQLVAATKMCDEWAHRYNDFARWLPETIARELEKFADGSDAMYLEFGSDDERLGYTIGRAALIGQIRREAQKLRSSGFSNREEVEP